MFTFTEGSTYLITPKMTFTPDAAVWIMPVVFLATFLLGSIPWGVIVGRIAYKKDIRKEGSGNIGTTNAMRTLGKGAGVAVFLLDFGKGLLSGYIGLIFSNNIIALADWLVCAPLGVAVLGCVWGHIFSPWLGFQGGKGIAVAIGAIIFAFGWLGALIEVALFAVLVVLTRYVSVGSIAAAVICPFLALWLHFGQWAFVICVTVAALTVIWAHRSNIVRLSNGKEHRIGAAKDKAA